MSPQALREKHDTPDHKTKSHKRKKCQERQGGARRKILQCNGIATSRDVKDKKFQEKM